MVKYLLLDFSDPEIPMDPDDIRSVPKIDTISFLLCHAAISALCTLVERQ